MSVKRAPGIFITLARRKAVDIDRLQCGEMALCEQELLIGYVSSRAREYILDQTDIAILAETSSIDWTDAQPLAQACGADIRTIDLLVEYGFLLSDATPQTPADRALSLWSEDALFFHQRCKWQGQDARLPADADGETGKLEASEEYFAERTELLGPIPHHFHHRAEPEDRTPLIAPEEPGALTEALRSRQTTRLYDTKQALDIKALSTAMKWSFGCHGTAQLGAGVVGLRKTSPSGGAMHPIEVYALALNVDGVEPGIYHYHVGDHALEPIQRVREAEGRALAARFVAGQNYYASANVLFLYTARFERSYWKYRHNSRAYKVALLDLGHLSQTLYLTCAQLGLGAFFTAACNEVDIESALGLDGIRESAMGVGGLGIPAANADAMRLRVRPYDPPR